MGSRGRSLPWLVAAAVIVGLGVWTHQRLSPDSPDPQTIAVTPSAPGQTGVSNQAPPRRPTRPSPRLAKPLPDDVIPDNLPEVSVQLQTAATQLGTLYADFDVEAYRKLFAKPPPPEVLEELLDWYESVLGSCGAPQPFLVRDSERARFLFTCTEGHWEAEVHVDAAGNITKLLQGARGVDPGAAVLEVAEQVMKLLEAWDEQLFRAIFSDRFESEEMRPVFAEFQAEWGPCELDDVDLANARGALFILACDQGPRMLKIDLDDNDKIRRFALRHPRPQP